MIGLAVKTDVEKSRISNAPATTAVLSDCGSLSVNNVSIERIELRHYPEKMDKERGLFSLITVYLKTSKGEIELKFDEGFRGTDPLPGISVILTRYTGLESLVNRALIAFNET